jgi:hypothetical protein
LGIGYSSAKKKCRVVKTANTFEAFEAPQQLGPINKRGDKRQLN